MKEYRITSENITGRSAKDCYLSPDDPAWEFMGIEGKTNLGEFLQDVEIINKEKPSD